MKLILKFFAIFFIIINILQSEVIRVPSERFKTIQDAIDFSFEGDTIIVKRGKYNEGLAFYGVSVTLASEYFFSKDKKDIEETIIGTEGTVINVMGVDKELNVTGFTISGGASWDGAGGISIDNSNTNFQNMIVKNNLGGIGAISVEGGSAKFKNLYIEGNIGIGTVISINDSANVHFDNVYFANNANLFGRGGFIAISNFSYVEFENFSYLNNYNLHNTKLKDMPVPGFLMNYLKNVKKSDIPRKTAEGIQLFNGSSLIFEKSLIWSDDKQQLYFPVELLLEEEEEDEEETDQNDFILEKSKFSIMNSSFKGNEESIKINESNSIIEFGDDVINSLSNDFGYIK